MGPAEGFKFLTVIFFYLPCGSTRFGSLSSTRIVRFFPLKIGYNLLKICPFILTWLYCLGWSSQVVVLECECIERVQPSMASATSPAGEPAVKAVSRKVFRKNARSAGQTGYLTISPPPPSRSSGCVPFVMTGSSTLRGQSASGNE